MNTLELKGGMIELIGQVKSEALLQHLYEIILEVVTDTKEDTAVLTVEQVAKLDEDIKASKNPKNLVDHKIAMKKMSRWLKN